MHPCASGSLPWKDSVDVSSKPWIQWKMEPLYIETQEYMGKHINVYVNHTHTHMKTWIYHELWKMFDYMKIGPKAQIILWEPFFIPCVLLAFCLLHRLALVPAIVQSRTHGFCRTCPCKGGELSVPCFDSYKKLLGSWQLWQAIGVSLPWDPCHRYCVHLLIRDGPIYIFTVAMLKVEKS